MRALQLFDADHAAPPHCGNRSSDALCWLRCGEIVGFRGAPAINPWHADVVGHRADIADDLSLHCPTDAIRQRTNSLPREGAARGACRVSSSETNQLRHIR